MPDRPTAAAVVFGIVTCTVIMTFGGAESNTSPTCETTTPRAEAICAMIDVLMAVV